MSNTWFYWADGQQRGPVAEDVLKSMAAAGTLRPEDLVRNEATDQWRAAGEATDWTFGPPPLAVASAVGPVAAAPLSYVSPTGEGLVLSPRVLDLLLRTSPWVRFIAVLSYIVAGLLALGGVGMIVLSLTRFIPRAGGAGVGVGVLYILFAALYLSLAGYLNRYASGIQRLKRMKRTVDLEDALDAQRGFWKFVGILTIVVLGAYVLIFAIGIVMR